MGKSDKIYCLFSVMVNGLQFAFALYIGIKMTSALVCIIALCRYDPYCLKLRLEIQQFKIPLGFSTSLLEQVIRGGRVCLKHTCPNQM